MHSIVAVYFDFTEAIRVSLKPCMRAKIRMFVATVNMHTTIAQPLLSSVKPSMLTL